MTITWIEEYYSGSEGPEGPQGPQGPAGDAALVKLGENGSKGDVVCSANSSVDPDLVLLAIPSALGDAGAIRGLLKADGLAGETVEIWGPGDIVAPADTGLTSDPETTFVIVNASARCERATVPSSTDFVVGTADKEGNLSVQPIPPGLQGGEFELVELVGTGSGGGGFLIGDVVCSSNESGETAKVKIAKTANLADAGANGIRVILRAGSAGDVREAAGPGDTVAASVLGLSAGSGDATVTIDTTTGRAVRTELADQATSQWVLGTCDAEGNTTIRPRRARELHAPFTPTRSAILGADGEDFKPKSWWPDLRDFFKADGGDGDFDEGCAAAIEAAMAAADDDGTELVVMPPAVGYRIERPVLAYDDDEHGNIRNFTMRGPNGRRSNVDTFVHDIPKVSGKAGNVTALSSPATGMKVQTFELNSGGSSVTVATKALWIGRRIRRGNAANPAHNGPSYIVDVPSDGVVDIGMPHTGAASSDANDGAITWEILQPMFDLRGRYQKIRNICCAAGPNGHIVDAFFELNHPTGSNANSVSGQALTNITIKTANPATRRISDGVWVARNFVPQSSTNGTAWSTDQSSISLGTAGLNSDGAFQVKAPYQVDGILIDDLYTAAAIEGYAVAFHSRTGQSKENYLLRGFINSRTGLGTPRDLYSSGTWSADGSAQFEPTGVGFSCRDTAIDWGSSGSGPRRAVGCYGENCARVIRTAFGALPQAVNVENCGWSLGAGHPSGEIMTLEGLGPFELNGGYVQKSGSADLFYALSSNGGGAARGLASFAFTEHHINFVTTHTARRGRVSSTQHGPFKIPNNSTSKFSVDGGADKTVTWTQSALNTIAGYTVDLDIVPAWVAGQHIANTLTGGTGWGATDDSFVHVETLTQGSGGSIRAKTGGTLADTVFGFDTAGTHFGLAAAEIETLTLGYFTNFWSNGAVYNIELTCDGVKAWNGVTELGFPHFHKKRFAYNANVGKVKVLPGGTFTATAGATSVVSNINVTATSLVLLFPANAAAATLVGAATSPYIDPANYVAGTSFTVSQPGGGAGGTEIFNYVILEAL